MEPVQIQTAQNVGIDFEVAGLGDRILAALIDYALLFCYLILFSIALGLVGWSWTALVVGLLPYLLYFLLCELFLNGQSIGKRVRKIKVARLDGSEPTLGNYLLRWVLRPIDVELFSGMVAIVTVAVNGRGQRLGDLAAGTTVLKLKPRVTLADTMHLFTETDHDVRFPQVDVLTDEEVATAKEVLHALVAEGKSRTAYLMGARMKAALEAKDGRRLRAPAAPLPPRRRRGLQPRPRTPVGSLRSR